MKPLQQYYILYAALIFESVDEILWCDNSNETSSGILSLGRTIYFACSSNFWICGWNPMARPFKWNLFSCTLKFYYLFSSNFRVCAQISIPYQIVRLVRQTGKKTAVLPNGEKNGHVIILWCFINTLSLRFIITCSWKRTVATANGMHDADMPTSAMAKFTNKRWSWVLIERFQNTTRQTEMLPRIPINVVMPSRIPITRTMPDSGILSVMLK